MEDTPEVKASDSEKIDQGGLKAGLSRFFDRTQGYFDRKLEEEIARSHREIADVRDPVNRAVRRFSLKISESGISTYGLVRTFSRIARDRLATK